jgi:hypothetical protein
MMGGHRGEARYFHRRAWRLLPFLALPAADDGPRGIGELHPCVCRAEGVGGARRGLGCNNQNGGFRSTFARLQTDACGNMREVDSIEVSRATRPRGRDTCVGRSEGPYCFLARAKTEDPGACTAPRWALASHQRTASCMTAERSPAPTAGDAGRALGGEMSCLLLRR